MFDQKTDILGVDPGYVAGAVACALATYIIYQRYFSPLARIPGPFLASISSVWIAHAYRRGDFHRYVIELHRKYGPIVRVAPNDVSVSDVNAIKIIYGSGSRFFKGKWYQHLRPPSGFNLLGIVDEQKHKKIRHLVDPIYTLKSIRESEPLMEEPMAFLVQDVKKKRGQPFNIIDYMNQYAVDTLTSIIYGQRYGLLEKDEFSKMLNFTEANWRNYFWSAMLPPMGKIAKIYQNTMILANVLLSGGKPPLPIFPWTAKRIESAMKRDPSTGQTPTILDKFVRLHRERPEEYPKEALDGAMFEAVFAGFETCGATMPKIMWRIATTEGCQARLQQELDTLKGQSDVKGFLSYDDLRSLPFLSACMSEGLRIDPITGINLSRSVPEGGTQMNGYFLPAGTEIGINPWVVSYNEEIMVNPYEFKPERWLEASKELKTKMDRMDLFFSAGPSSCPGRVMAIALMYKTISVIFTNFNVEAMDPSQHITEVNMFPVKWRNVNMKLIPRT